MTYKTGDAESFGFMRRKDEERRPWQVWESPTGVLIAFDIGVEPMVTRVFDGRNVEWRGGMRIEPGQFKRKKEKDAY